MIQRSLKIIAIHGDLVIDVNKTLSKNRKLFLDLVCL
jgi:hypothetical protein